MTTQLVSRYNDNLEKKYQNRFIQFIPMFGDPVKLESKKHWFCDDCGWTRFDSMSNLKTQGWRFKKDHVLCENKNCKSDLKWVLVKKEQTK